MYLAHISKVDELKNLIYSPDFSALSLFKFQLPFSFFEVLREKIRIDAIEIEMRNERGICLEMINIEEWVLYCSWGGGNETHLEVLDDLGVAAVST